MNELTAYAMGIREPICRREQCACGLVIEAIDHPDTIAHALRVHYDHEQHRLWAAEQERGAPTFPVPAR